MATMEMEMVMAMVLAMVLAMTIMEIVMWPYHSYLSRAVHASQ